MILVLIVEALVQLVCNSRPPEGIGASRIAVHRYALGPGFLPAPPRRRLMRHAAKIYLTFLRRFWARPSRMVGDAA